MLSSLSHKPTYDTPFRTAKLMYCRRKWIRRLKRRFNDCGVPTIKEITEKFFEDFVMGYGLPNH